MHTSVIVFFMPETTQRCGVSGHELESIRRQVAQRVDVSSGIPSFL
jgi:hypothetical protein